MEKRRVIKLAVGEFVLTERRGRFFAAGFDDGGDDGVPRAVRCCNAGHVDEGEVDACWGSRRAVVPAPEPQGG